MILGIGHDLTEIKRIEDAISRQPRFLARVFTPSERELISRKGIQTAAGFFAAKEAVAKALGTGFNGFFADAISIGENERGKPEATLTGGALARFTEMGGRRIHLSVTHEAGLASAVAIIED